MRKNSDLLSQRLKKHDPPAFLTLQCWRASSKAIVLTKTSARSCGLAEVNAALWLCFGLSYLWTWHSSAGVEPSLTPSGAVSRLWPPAPLSPEIKCPTQLPASAKLKKKKSCQEPFLSARVNNEPCIFTAPSAYQFSHPSCSFKSCSHYIKLVIHQEVQQKSL